jgi:hypothetical protein
MRTKFIIDSETAIAKYNATAEGKTPPANKITQKELAEEVSTSEQNLINWKNSAPKVLGVAIKISEFTGVPLSDIVKEVAV